MELWTGGDDRYGHHRLTYRALCTRNSGTRNDMDATDTKTSVLRRLIKDYLYLCMEYGYFSTHTAVDTM